MRFYDNYMRFNNNGYGGHVMVQEAGYKYPRAKYKDKYEPSHNLSGARKYMPVFTKKHAKEFHDTCGISLWAKNFPGIDIDIDDLPGSPVTVAQVQEIVFSILGKGMKRSRPGSPRCLYIYEGNIMRHFKSIKFIHNGERQGVDFMTGDNHYIAEGWHHSGEYQSVDFIGADKLPQANSVLLAELREALIKLFWESNVQWSSDTVPNTEERKQIGVRICTKDIVYHDQHGKTIWQSNGTTDIYADFPYPFRITFQEDKYDQQDRLLACKGEYREVSLDCIFQDLYLYDGVSCYEPLHNNEKRYLNNPKAGKLFTNIRNDNGKVRYREKGEIVIRSFGHGYTRYFLKLDVLPEYQRLK